MKKFAFVSILAAVCSLTALANEPIPGDTGCAYWSLDDGYYKACVDQAIVDGGYTASFQDTNQDPGGPGVVYVKDYADGGQDSVFQSARPDLNDCKRNDVGACIDPNPN